MTKKYTTLRSALDELKEPTSETVKNDDAKWQALAYILEQTVLFDYGLDIEDEPEGPPEPRQRNWFVRLLQWLGVLP